MMTRHAKIRNDDEKFSLTMSIMTQKGYTFLSNTGTFLPIIIYMQICNFLFHMIKPEKPRTDDDNTFLTLFKLIFEHMQPN